MCNAEAAMRVTCSNFCHIHVYGVVYVCTGRVEQRRPCGRSCGGSTSATASEVGRPVGFVQGVVSGASSTALVSNVPASMPKESAMHAEPACAKFGHV